MQIAREVSFDESDLKRYIHEGAKADGVTIESESITLIASITPSGVKINAAAKRTSKKPSK